MNTLAILDYEEAYVNRLMEYMNQKKDFGFQVMAFTEESKLKIYEENNKIDVLLCAEDIAEISASDYKANAIYVLSDYNYVREGERFPSIFKYQSAESIINEILQHFSKGNKNIKVIKQGNTEVIGICSAVGGCYKSTFALALALYCAKQDNTLFISFDPFYSVPEFNKEESMDNLSDIIYYLKQSNLSIPVKIKSVIQRKQNLDILTGVAHWIDLYDFTVEEARSFLVEIMEHMSYQTIIIDIGGFGVNAMELMSGCSSIYVPTRGNNYYEREKDKEWKRQIKFIGGEHVLERIEDIEVPYDSRLDGNYYGFDALKEGVLGEFIESKFAK